MFNNYQLLISSIFIGAASRYKNAFTSIFPFTFSINYCLLSVQVGVLCSTDRSSLNYESCSFFQRKPEGHASTDCGLVMKPEYTERKSYLYLLLHCFNTWYIMLNSNLFANLKHFSVYKSCSIWGLQKHEFVLNKNLCSLLHFMNDLMLPHKINNFLSVSIQTWVQ